MLVLSRLVGEVIVINDNIMVKVISVDRGKVRLGIECDASIPVYRKEVWDQIQQGLKQE